VFVQHPDAAVGNGQADGARRVRAVDAVIGVAPVLKEIERPRPQRIAGPAGLDIVVVDELAIGARVAFDHFVGGAPCGPFAFGPDHRGTLEFQPRAPDTDAIAQRLARRGDVVKEMSPRQHQQLAGAVTCPDLYAGWLEFRV